MAKKGGSDDVTTRVELPPWAEKAAQQFVERGLQLGEQPYQPFMGPRIAPFSQDTQASFEAARQNVGSHQPFITQAATMLGQVTPNFNQSIDRNPIKVTKPNVARLDRVQDVQGQNVGFGGGAFGFGPRVQAQNVGFGQQGDFGFGPEISPMQFNTESVQQFMNPFADTVMQNTLDEMRRQMGVSRQAVSDAAKQAGAFGGSRHGIVEAEQLRNDQRGMSDMIARLNMENFNQALNQFNTQQGVDLQSQLANMDARTRAALSNQQAGLTADTTNLDAGLRAALSNQGVDMQAQAANQGARLGENRALFDALNQFRQAGADRRLDTLKFNREAQLADFLANANVFGENFGRATDAATTLAGLGDTLSSLNLRDSETLRNIGAQQEAMTQQHFDQAYQDFLRQVAYPHEQLNFMSSILGMQPMGNTQTQTQPAPDRLGQLIGLAGTLGGSFLMSDENAKEERADGPDPEAVLEGFRSLPIETWRYKPEHRATVHDDGSRHTGPMAQEWAKRFGGDGKTINLLDALGNIMTAIRGLEARTAT